MIAIIDYGMGNLHSVRKALELLGGRAVVTNNPTEIKKCSKAVLPGVGAFGDAMEELRKLNLCEAILRHIRDRKIFLGICLGMHLLFEFSEESPDVAGMGLLKGRVEKFKAAQGFKVPHMGWNQIAIKNTGCPLFKDFQDASEVYFCHSYFPRPQDESVVAATTEYGGTFGSILWKDNVFAAQFHPEKSQRVGLKILENFVNL